MKQFLLVLLFGAVLCSLTGCGNATLSDVVYSHPFSFGGNSEQPELAEPANAVVTNNYEADNANKSNSLPIVFEMRDAETIFSVSRENLLGNPESAGSFDGGKIIKQELKKVARANFRLVDDEDVSTAVAKFVVSPKRVSIRQVARSNNAVATVTLQIQIKKLDDSATAYSRDFSFSTEKEEWTSQNEIPSAFYIALNEVLKKFLQDWANGSSVPLAIVNRWHDEATPGIKMPELENLTWTQDGDACVGRCVVRCNDYEPFRAKAWANAQIAIACRTKLDNVERERLRILYDGESIDDDKKWSFAFHAFKRSEMVLSFDKRTRHGQVTGDLLLMMKSQPKEKINVEAAIERLKQYVFSQMGSYVGVVNEQVQQGQADVRFDKIEHDIIFDLVTIKFRLM
jgi:hypothetical protein